MLVLIPFDIAIVDSLLAPAQPGASAPAAAAAAAAAAYPPIVRTILSLCQGYLGSPGSTREMAAVVLGRLLTRPDMAPALHDFLDWGCAALDTSSSGSSSDGGGSQRASFLVPGEGRRESGWAGRAGGMDVCSQGRHGRVQPGAAWTCAARGGKAVDLEACCLLAADIGQVALLRCAVLTWRRHGAGLRHAVQARPALRPAGASGAGLPSRRAAAGQSAGRHQRPGQVGCRLSLCMKDRA